MYGECKLREDAGAGTQTSSGVSGGGGHGHGKNGDTVGIPGWTRYWDPGRYTTTTGCTLEEVQEGKCYHPF